jgi:prephenate dehydratase
MRVAIQGERGSYHHIAAENYFGSDIELICCESFAAVFDALGSGAADTAVVAVENSTAGSVHPVYDLLLRHDFFITGEVYEPIHHCLVALPGTEIIDIERVYSHPMALPQCADFLDENLPHAERIEFSDTAASAKHIKQTNDKHAAAIASSLAAKLENLQILRSNVEDYHHNVTRFLVLSPSHKVAPGANKSSFVLETPHKPGALVSALKVLADADINLTKLESRPIPSEPWRYQFLIDVETGGGKLHESAEKLKALGCAVRILGEYKSAGSSV